MKILFANIISKLNYEDIINRLYININEMERKDIYLKFIDENTRFLKKTKKNLTHNYNFQKLNKKDEHVEIISENINKNVEEDINDKW